MRGPSVVAFDYDCGGYGRLLACRRYAGLVATLILELLSGVPLRTAVSSAAAELGITNLDQLAQVPPPTHQDGTPMLPEAFGDLPVVQRGFGLSCCEQSFWQCGSLSRAENVSIFSANAPWLYDL